MPNTSVASSLCHILLNTAFLLYNLTFTETHTNPMNQL